MPSHRNLNVKKFLDSVSEPLLRDYFQWKCDGVSPVESYDPQTIECFLDSHGNSDLTAIIREDFNQINDISETVMNHLIRAANLYGVERAAEEKREHLAMRLFLHHKDAFEYAYDKFCI